jgi:hypothetical protein
VSNVQPERNLTRRRAHIAGLLPNLLLDTRIESDETMAHSRQEMARLIAAIVIGVPELRAKSR